MIKYEFKQYTRSPVIDIKVNKMGSVFHYQLTTEELIYKDFPPYHNLQKAREVLGERGTRNIYRCLKNGITITIICGT